MSHIGDEDVIANLTNGKEKTTLLLPGGGQGCIYQAGVIKYFEEQKLHRNIKAIYGNSGGTIMGLYLLGDGIASNVGCMYEEHVTGRFVDLGRGRGMIDTAGLSARMLTTRGIDFDIFKNREAELYAGTTNLSSGDHSFYRVPKTTPEEAMPVVFASFAIPAIGKLRVWINGERETDGAFSEPLPAEYVDSQSENLLVILTKPFGKVSELPTWLVNRFNGYPRALLNHTRRYNKGIDYLTQKVSEPNSKVCVIYPKSKLSPSCMDKSLLMQAEEVSHNYSKSLSEKN